MITHLGRKVTAIVLTIAASLLAMFWPDRTPIPLGLDLKGGSRLIYRLDIEAATKEGRLGPGGSQRNPAEVLEEQRQILQERVDTLGLRDIPVLAQGTNEILIELPGMGKDEVDNIKRVIENLGELEFRIVADQSKGDSVDFMNEKKKLDEWQKANPELSLRIFNLTAEKDGGPREGYKWYPNADKDKAMNPYHLLRIEKEEKWIFHSRKQFLEKAYPTQDMAEGMVVAFAVYDKFKADFEEFTRTNVGRRMAIVLNGEVRSAPNIRSALPGSGVITGGFKVEEVKALTNVLRTGSLAVKPELQSAVTVGASLGQDAIDRAKLSTMITMIIIPLFMIVYYGGSPFWFSSGVIASIALLFNLFLILGSMAFFRATLTLPGIGGLILTVGMAVDSNILIYERIREEREKGRSLTQSIENGFDMAAATIIDSNLTTLLTGIILFFVGSGPIKGFAVTLSIGILTTLFATLVVSKVLFHVGLKKGWIREIKYLHLLTKPNLNFMKYKNVAVWASIVFIIASFWVFLKTDDNTKYGLDFTGGAIVRVQLEKPTPHSEIQARVAKTYEGASVNQNQTSNVSAIDFAKGISDEFTIKFKLSEEARAHVNEGKEPAYIEELRGVLKGLLINDGIGEVVIDNSSGGAKATANFNLELAHETTETAIRSALSFTKNLGSPKISGSGKSWKIRGIVPSDISVQSLRSDLLNGFVQASANKVENAPVLLNPFPEHNQLGARAVSNLRDEALRALILAFIGIILYLRFRFLEYRWGFGAVVAILHDVAVSIGAVVIVQSQGWVSAEIDLTMLAAFLTIIGYSVNDTIVIFDRIRENAPRAGVKIGTESEGRIDVGLMEKLMNDSINQTLSRTILTAFTVFVVVTIMFICNFGRGNVLEGFAFSMMVGTFVGCYSSIYIASPIVLSFVRRDQAKLRNPNQAVASAKETVQK